jgi:hypothetical protein
VKVDMLPALAVAGFHSQSPMRTGLSRTGQVNGHRDAGGRF